MKPPRYELNVRKAQRKLLTRGLRGDAAAEDVVPETAAAASEIEDIDSVNIYA